MVSLTIKYKVNRPIFHDQSEKFMVLQEEEISWKGHSDNDPKFPWHSGEVYSKYKKWINMAQQKGIKIISRTLRQGDKTIWKSQS